MNDINISVCIPVYNVEKYIERCVRSLFEQTMTDGVEYLFIDDCTQDQSFEILDLLLNEYPQCAQRVRIFHQEKNKGLASARNLAIRNAWGEYVFHLDSDDYLPKDSIQNLWKKAKEDNADFVIGNMDFIYKHCSIIHQPQFNFEKKRYIEAIACRESDCMICGNLVRRALYIDNNIFVPEKINMGEDFVTTPRLLCYAEKISFLSKVTYFYEQRNQQSYTKNKMTEEKIDNIIEALQILSVFFKERQEDFPVSKMLDCNLSLLISFCRYSLSNLRYLKTHYSSPSNKVFKELRFKDRIFMFLYCHNNLRTIVLLGNMIYLIHPVYQILVNTFSRKKENK